MGVHVVIRSMIAPGEFDRSRAVTALVAIGLVAVLTFPLATVAIGIFDAYRPIVLTVASGTGLALAIAFIVRQLTGS